MYVNHPHHLLAVSVSALVITAVGAQPTTAVAAVSQQPAAEERLMWRGSWSTAPQRPSAGFTPNWAEKGFAGHTLRQVVQLSTGGSSIRIRLSNRYGSSPLKVSGATIARSASGASIQPGSLRRVTFDHDRSVVISPGDDIASDAVRLPAKAGQSVTITLYFKERTGPATFHSQAGAHSYRAEGDQRTDVDAKDFTEKTPSWYYLTDVETAGASEHRKTVVAFGDSITDGVGSSLDANRRYPDQLAERLRAKGKARPVLNLGIAANRLLHSSNWYGQKAIARFQRDVLDKPDVSTVIILEGINDIGFSDWDDDVPTAVPNPQVSLKQLVAGHRKLIRHARARDIKVIGGTLLPYKGFSYYTERGERVRDALNKWIRTSGEYDEVVDFDRLLAAPDDPDKINPAYDSGDHLHPNDAGYRVMAKAIRLGSLR